MSHFFNVQVKLEQSPFADDQMNKKFSITLSPQVIQELRVCTLFIWQVVRWEAQVASGLVAPVDLVLFLLVALLSHVLAGLVAPSTVSFLLGQQGSRRWASSFPLSH